MKKFIVFLFLFCAFPLQAAEDYSNCDVDIGCSDDVADYQSVPVKVIDLAEFRRLYDSEERFSLIDVRPKASYDYRHIKGARSLFVARAQPEKIKRILSNKEQTIVVYCGNPRCPMSQHAAQMLKFLGYKNVMNYKGGLEEWSRNGLPVASSIPDSPLSVGPLTLPEENP